MYVHWYIVKGDEISWIPKFTDSKIFLNVLRGGVALCKKAVTVILNLYIVNTYVPYIHTLYTFMLLHMPPSHVCLHSKIAIISCLFYQTLMKNHIRNPSIASYVCENAQFSPSLTLLSLRCIQYALPYKCTIPYPCIYITLLCMYTFIFINKVSHVFYQTNYGRHWPMIVWLHTRLCPGTSYFGPYENEIFEHPVRLLRIF